MHTQSAHAPTCLIIGEFMFTYILSADVPYADIAFIAILALGLVLGIIRGFSKSFKGFFLTIAIMLASLLLLTPTFAAARDMDMFVSMEESITSSIEDKTELFAKPIYIENDAESGDISFLVEVQLEDGTTQRVALSEGLDEGGTSAIKARLALWLADKFIEEDGQTLGGVAGMFISDLIVAVALFIVYCIVLGLLCWLLRKLFARMRKSDSRVLKAIDRVAGGIVSTAFACVFALLVLAILYALRDKIGSLNEMLENSTICAPFYLNNPIARLFTEIFG